MNKSFNKKIYFILVFSAIFLPYSVFASNIYIDASHPDFFVGDTIIFSVRVDSENKNINAVEGSVLLDYLAESISLIDINTAGSKFSLWPGKPLPSESNTSISFAGGAPGGFNSKDAVIFNIVLQLQKAGQITLTPDNLSVYLHDGKGTRDTTNIQNLIINVLPPEAGYKPVNELSALISQDKTPPESFEIIAGQDVSVFEGKKFLSFSAVDKQSGIKYYEVREGDLPPTRSDGTYVLQNQDKPTKVVVVAYDAAGNARESVLYTILNSYLNLIAIVVFVMLLFVTFGLVVKKMKKNDSIQK